MTKTYSIVVDTKYKDKNLNIWFTSGDVGNILTITVNEEGTPISLAGLSAKLYFYLSDGTSVENTCTVGSTTISCTLGTSELAQEGLVRAQLKLTETTHIISTNSFYFEVRKNCHTDSVVSTVDYGETPTISSGIVAPTSTPTKIGNIYIDTVLGKVWISCGILSSADWKILN